MNPAYARGCVWARIAEALVDVEFRGHSLMIRRQRLALAPAAEEVTCVEGNPSKGCAGHGKATQQMTLFVVRRKFSAKPRKAWAETRDGVWECADLMVWHSGNSSWPWRAQCGGATLQVNGRDRWFVNAEAAMAAAEKMGASLK